MYLLRIVCIISILSTSIILHAQSQSVINGPLLGFIPNTDGTVIWPVIGIPGASALGNPLDFGMDLAGTVISPKQDYAIAMRIRDRQIVVVPLAASELGVMPVAGTHVPGTHPGSSVTSFGPSGTTAAIYDDDSKTVQVIAHLPSAPEIIHEFDASALAGNGSVSDLTVSDDGGVVLVTFVDCENAGLWVMDPSGASWRVSAERPSAAAFFPNSQDAVIADDATQSAFLLKDITHAATQIPLISAGDGLDSFSSISVSEDSRRVFLADSKSGTVAIVDMETLRPALVACHCHSTGLYSLKGAGVFRLTAPLGDPFMVLDASAVEPRIVVIPPNAPAAEQVR